MSKYLRKLVDYHERQVFAGPPETTRDFVVAAARALSRGNWRKTSRLLLGMPAWELLEKTDRERVKAMLATHVQEVGLKTYLFTYCLSFETLSIAMLAEVSHSSFSLASCLVMLLLKFKIS
jgi:translation initiation factor 3 subunit C